MKTIVINATLTTVGPLSITMPIAEGQLGNKFNNFPIVTRGMDEDGNKQQTGYLPATTLRGFLRRAIVIDQMTHAAVLAAADDPDPARKRGQVCEANFYSGELSLANGLKDEATRLFRLAASDCPHGFLEWDAANAELKALGVVP